MLTYADVCWRMLTYANVFWRMLTYAVAKRGEQHNETYVHGNDLLLLLRNALSQVLSRMLTYAHVC
jgi:hypothetical protein